MGRKEGRLHSNLPEVLFPHQLRRLEMPESTTLRAALEEVEAMERHGSSFSLSGGTTRVVPGYRLRDRRHDGREMQR